MSTVNVIDLSQRLAIHPLAHSFLAMLSVGPELNEALKVTLPSLPKDQQRALLTVVAFRLMGTMLPANVTLLEHMPTLSGLHDQTIAAAFQLMVDGGVLEIQEADPKAEDPIKRGMCFYWPALERLVVKALEEANTTPLVGLDGNRLRS